MNTTNVKAASSLTLVDTPPPQVVEGEYYSWQIPVQGGTPPYGFSLHGEIPSGLYLSSTGFIYGTPEKNLSRSSYQVIIVVYDSSFRQMRAEQTYAFLAVYKSIIRIAGTQFAGETNVYIDGNSTGKLQGNNSMTKYFPSGEWHSISVDYQVVDPTDSNTRYVFNIRYITVSSSSPSAEFAYSIEYHIEAITKPENAYYYFSSDWYSLSHWYEKGSTWSYSVPSQIQASNDTQYHFSHWSFPPGSQRQIDNELVWTVNTSGEIVANYDIYYRLTINSDYGGEIEGEGFYKSGDVARWRIRNYDPPPAFGIFGLLGMKLRPSSSEGFIVMDSSKIITLGWGLDYSSVTGPILSALIGSMLGGLIVYWIIRRRSPYAP